jgi:hypothetical protein
MTRSKKRIHPNGVTTLSCRFLSIVFLVENSAKRRTFTPREHLDPGTPKRECGRAIDAQMRKVGFGRSSRHARPDSSRSLQSSRFPKFYDEPFNKSRSLVAALLGMTEGSLRSSG